MPKQHRIKLMGSLLARLTTRYLGCKLRRPAYYYKKVKRTPAYHFQLGSGCSAKHLPRNTKDWADYDILVLCGKEHRSCLFFHVSQIQQYSKRMQGSAFSRAAEEESWLKAVALAKEMRL